MIQKHSKAFTLIEVIVVLLIMGIMVTIGSMGLGNVVEGYFYARDNAKTTLDVQAGLMRIEKEMAVARNVNSATARSLNYDGYRKNGVTETHTLSWSGTAGDSLLLDTESILDDVTSFSMIFYDSYDSATTHTNWTANRNIIELTVTVNGAMGIDSTFVTRIKPRNLNL